jgi:hypothetical protein
VGQLLVHVSRERVTVDAAGVAQLFELKTQLYGRLVSLVVAKVEDRSGVTIAANVYDREEAPGINGDSADDDTTDSLPLLVAEAHRIIPSQAGTNGVLAAYGLDGYFRNSDEPTADARLEKSRLWLELTTSGDGEFDVSATVVGIY